jgi:hypothetical protein
MEGAVGCAGASEGTSSTAVKPKSNSFAIIVSFILIYVRKN